MADTRGSQGGRSMTSLREIADELGLEKGTKTEGRTDYACPVHDNKTPDLSIYHGSHFACHGEGGASPVTLVMHCKGWNDVEKAVEWLQEHFPSERHNSEDAKRTSKAREVLEKAVTLAQDALNKQEEDLKQKIMEKRQFEEEDIERYRIGYLSYDDIDILKNRFDDKSLQDSGLFGKGDNGLYSHLAGRIIYPYLFDNSPVYLAGRKDYRSDDDSAKYKKLRKTSYNRHALYQLNAEDQNELVVTEGAADAISGHKAGFNVVSPLTTRFSRDDIEKIVSRARNYERVYIVNDGDEAGKEGAVKTAEELAKEEIDSQLIQLPEGEDLDDYTSENGYDISELVEDSESFLMSLIDSCNEADEEDNIQELEKETERLLKILADWSGGKAGPYLKRMPGNKRDLTKQMKALEEEKNQQKEDVEVEEFGVEEVESVNSQLKITEDVEVGLNPVSSVFIQELEKTHTVVKSNGSGVIRPENKFKIYKLAFGEGSEEKEYTLFAGPQEDLNLGDNTLVLRQADIRDERYESYLKEMYHESDFSDDDEKSFEDYLEMYEKRAGFFELDSELPEQAKEKIKNLENSELIGVVEEYLDYGFEKDKKLKDVMYPKIVKHDKKKTMPKAVMPYNPHGMMFTNTKAGKTYTADSVGIRRDNVTPAGLVGYASAEDGKKTGILHRQDESFFADEINFGNKEKLNDRMLTLLETGEVTDSKAGMDIRTEYYGSFTYMANPVDQEENLDITEKFLRLIECLGHNVEAMGSRFGVILFDTGLNPAQGSQIDQERGRKLETLVKWVKSELAKEYTEIENEMQDWIEQEYPDHYLEFVDKIRIHSLYDKVLDFWDSHKQSYRHARGQALRMAVYNNMADVISGDYSLKELEADAEDAFTTVMEINKDSLQTLSNQLDDEELAVERSRAVLEGQKPAYLKLLVKTVVAHRNKGNSLEKLTPLSTLRKTFQEIKPELEEVDQNSKYWKWSNVEKKISENRIEKQDLLSHRYGIWLASEKDMDMVKIGNSAKFKPYARLDIPSGGDQSDGSDDNEESTANKGVSDDSNTHTDNQKAEDEKSSGSQESPLERAKERMNQDNLMSVLSEYGEGIMYKEEFRKRELDFEKAKKIAEDSEMLESDFGTPGESNKTQNSIRVKGVEAQ